MLEAQKLLKSLTIAAMRAPAGREQGPERVVEILEVSNSGMNPEEEKPPVAHANSFGNRITI